MSQQQQEQQQQLTTEQQIIDAYNGKRREQQAIMQRISELEGEIHEHNLVLDQLGALEDGRRAHRLVSGALIEKTVGEIKPEIADNLHKFNAMIKSLQDQLVQKEKDMEDFMTKYKITRRPPGGDSSVTAAQKEADDTADKQQGGVLA